MSVTNLRRVALFRGLPRAALRRILDISRTSCLPAGATIFRKNESADRMFVVLEGRVKIYSQSGARKRKTFAYLQPGDFFGEMAIIDGQERSASAQAVEPSRLLMIRRADFRRLLDADAGLTRRLLKAVGARLRRADEEIESLLFCNVLGRVARTLDAIVRECGTRAEDGVRVRRRYTHQELADLVGTTREPLSRALGMLRRAGIAETGQGRILVREPRRLALLAHGGR